MKTTHHSSDQHWIPRHKGRILVVDDSRTQRALVTSLLEKRGLTVETAEKGTEGLEKLQKTDPDLVLLDVVLPDIDGFRLCRLIRSKERYQSLPVIFITSLDKREDILRGFAAGASDYVAKPIAPEEFMARVMAHLNVALLHRERLEALELLTEAKGRLQRTALAEGLAHNLNNLLAPLMGNLSWLDSELPEGEPKKAVREMLDVVERLHQVIQALTGFLSSRSSTTTGPIGHHLSTLCDGLEPQLPEGVRLVRSFDPNDQTPLPQAILPAISALLTNAAEATTEGQIEISVQKENAESGDDSCLTIEIRDTGKGLDKKTKHQAFIPFFSTKDVVGAGLGLHAAQLAAERFGGTVTLDGAPGRGALARLRIPNLSRTTSSSGRYVTQKPCRS